MTKRDPQKYVPYRACSDQYRIDFFGGPLDGAQIITDVFPDADVFVHHVGRSRCRYRYYQTAKFQFRAQYEFAPTPDSAAEGSHLSPFQRWNGWWFVAALVVAVVATSLMAILF